MKPVGQASPKEAASHGAGHEVSRQNNNTKADTHDLYIYYIIGDDIGFYFYFPTLRKE